MSDQKKLLTREEIDVKKTWDLTPIFKSDEQWEEAFAYVGEAIKKAGEFQGKILASKESFLKAILYREDLFLKASHVSLYARLLEDTDTGNSKNRERNMRAGSLVTEAVSALSFFDVEILLYEKAEVDELLKDEKLSVYQHEFDELFRSKEHVLSEKEENLLAKASDVLDQSHNIFSVLDNAELVFPDAKDKEGATHELTHGAYGVLLESTDEILRKSAYENMYETYGKFKNTYAATLSGQVKTNNFLADIRGFGSAREAALFSNVIPEEVYDALISAVHGSLSSLHKYVDLRKKVMGLEEVHMYDLYVPMVDDIEIEFDFEEAKKEILEALSVLGDEYVQVLEDAFSNRWIDLYENKGKMSGAYSSGTYGTNPYILMNWKDNLDNMYTLAHELGHSVHSYFSRKYQPYTYSNYSIFLAEIASTTNENLLTEHLLKKYKGNKKITAYLLNHYLDGVKGTVFRQTQFAEFEKLIHEFDADGTALTADFLSKEYGALNKKYYGKSMTYDGNIDLEWARIPHFYYDFYVYQYATGFSAAAFFTDKILNGGAKSIALYLEYLKSGSAKYPIEILKKAGADMTGNQTILDVLNIFEKRLTEFENMVTI